MFLAAGAARSWKTPPQIQSSLCRFFRRSRRNEDKPSPRASIVKLGAFTTGVIGVSFCSSFVYHYQRRRQEARRGRGVDDWMPRRGRSEGRSGPLGNLVEKIQLKWRAMSHPGRVCVGMIAVNCGVFLLWRVPALQSSMARWFLTDPHSTQIIMTKMADCLAKHSIKQSVQEYLHCSGIDRLFPRAAAYLTHPDTSLEHISNPEMERYTTQLSQLNNVLTVSQQLNTDIQNPSVHKYVAHQMAVLYLCVNQIGAPLVTYKKDIESHFATLKTVCSTSEGKTPQLPFDLYSWLNGLTTQLSSEALSMKAELTTSVLPLFEVMNNVKNKSFY